MRSYPLDERPSFVITVRRANQRCGAPFGVGAWKVPTERAEFILPGIQSVAASFGVPCAIMRDLGRAMKEAADEFVRSLKDPIPVLACHLHFLSDIGEDLLEEEHDELRNLFRKVGLLQHLRAFVRQQSRNLGGSIEQ